MDDEWLVLRGAPDRSRRQQSFAFDNPSGSSDDSYGVVSDQNVAPPDPSMGRARAGQGLPKKVAATCYSLPTHFILQFFRWLRASEVGRFGRVRARGGVRG